MSLKNIGRAFAAALLNSLLIASADTEAPSPADANYDAIVDPVKLADMTSSVMDAVTFDDDTYAPDLRADGLSGSGLDLAKIKVPLTFDCEKVINPSAGSVSWWIRFRSEITDATTQLAQVDEGGWMYIMYQGSQAWDVRHRHRLGHYFFRPDAIFIHYPNGICPTADQSASRWVNITWTWETNRSRVYVDGELASEQTHDARFSQYAKAFKRLQLGSPGQDATIDEVRFYNRALTQADVRGYVTAARSDALRALALQTPESLAAKQAGSLRAVYRVSDHAMILYADLSEMLTGPDDVTVLVTDNGGRAIVSETTRVKNPRTILRSVHSLPPDLADGSYTVSLKPSAKQGALAATFTRKRYPWEGNLIGIGSEVPQPWHPIAVRGPSLRHWQRTFSVWGREMTLADFGLPAELKARQPEPTRGPEVVNILADPVRLVAIHNGRELPWKRTAWRIASQSDREVVITGTATSDAFTASLKGTLEFDGFYKVSLRLTPRRERVDIDKLLVEIPVPNRQAVLFNAASDAMRAQKTFLDIEHMPDGILWDSITAITNTAETARTTPDRPRPIPIWPHVWLGNDDRGIAMMVENARTWPIDPRQPVMDLMRKDGVTTLRLLLANRPASITEPIEVTFSLQATPVRPRPPGGTGKAMEWYGWGYFDLPVIAANLKPGNITLPPTAGGPWYRTPKARETNRWWRYGCLQSHRVSPDDPVYGTMIKATRDEWENGLYTPSHIDFLMWVYKKWHERESLDGMYYDNTYPQRANGFGSNIAYVDDSGALQPSFNVFAQREFLKRLQYYFQSVGPLPVIMSHVTDCPAVGYLGFADLWLDGENGGYLSHASQATRSEENAPRDFVDRWYNPTGMANLRITLGRQWGSVPRYLYEWGIEPTHAVLGMFDLQNGYKSMGKTPYHEFGRFEPDVRFIPYWTKPFPAQLIDGGPDLFLTAWTRQGRARLLISNLSPNDQSTAVRIDLSWLRLQRDAIAMDEREGSALPMQDAVLAPIRIAPHDYRVILLANPGLYTPLAPDFGRELRPVPERLIPALCDDFTAISDAWQQRVSPEIKTATHSAHGIPSEPFATFADHLRIRTSSYIRAYLQRPFEQDNCTVQIKLREPDGHYGSGFGPGMHLIWKDGRSVSISAWEIGPGYPLHCWGIRNGKTVFAKSGPKPNRINWVRIALKPKTIEFHTSTDAKTWQLLHAQPRQDFEGAPDVLAIGHGSDHDGPLEGYAYDSYFSELFTAHLNP